MANTNTNKAAEKAAAEKAAAESKVQDTEAKTDNRVPLFIPKGAANDEPSLIIGINGKIYTLPKGKKSMVPPEVKAEYDRSVKAQEALDEHIEEMLEKAQKGIGEL